DDGLQRLATRLVQQCDQGRHALGLGHAGLGHHLVRQLLLGRELSRCVLQQPRLGRRNLRLPAAQDVHATAGVARLVVRGPRRQPHQGLGRPCLEHPAGERSEAKRGTGLDPVPRRPHPVRVPVDVFVYQPIGAPPPPPPPPPPPVTPPSGNVCC